MTKTQWINLATKYERLLKHRTNLLNKYAGWLYDLIGEENTLPSSYPTEFKFSMEVWDIPFKRDGFILENGKWRDLE